MVSNPRTKHITITINKDIAALATIKIQNLSGTINNLLSSYLQMKDNEVQSDEDDLRTQEVALLQEMDNIAAKLSIVRMNIAKTQEEKKRLTEERLEKMKAFHQTVVNSGALGDLL